MSTICRLCGLPCEHSIDIFGRPNDVSIPVLQYKINQLLGIAVGQCDNLPHSVCLPCDSKLESLWCFRNTCHQAQIQLRKTCKTNSSTIRLTHREKELYSLGPSSSTGLLVHKDNSRKSSDNVSKQESICTNFVSAKLTDDARPTPSVSNSIGTTLIHTPSVNNCISSDDEGDCNDQIEEDDSMSVASEENADCSIDRISSDRISQTTIVNVSNYNCKDVEMNTSSITKGADDNNPSSTPNEQSDTGIPPSSTSTCSEIVQSFEGHYYRMETDMNSDLLCNRIPYLLVESKMGTNHMIYTVSPDVSKFDSNQDVLLDSGELGLYLTMQKYDFNNFNVVRTLNQWINSLLKGEMSLMPYYFSWLDEKNQPIVGFKCIICKHILNRNRQVVMNHIADHLLWTCPVCGCFFRNITKWRFHFLQHDSISLECSTCDEKFGSDYEKYKVHKRSYYKFECSSCHFKCSDKDTWLVHLKKDRKEHCSSDCGMFYETIDEFQKHVSKLSSVGGYVCGVCGMAYHCEEYLKLHLRVHGLEHGSKTTSTCSLAADSQNEVAKKIDLIINSNADVHFDLLKKVIDNEVDVNDFKMSSMAHGGRVFIGFKCFRFRKCKVVQSEKKFRLHLGNHFMMTCLCKNFFRNLKKLKDHFRQHSFERRMCVLCKEDVWLNTSTEYLEHVSLHQKGRICIHCQSVFPNFNRLRDHARRCHNETKVGSWKLKSKIVCNICGKSIHKEEINHHMQRVHQTYDEDKIKIFICAYCGKEFTNRPGFVLHIRRHMNEKNYKCDICGKTFNRRSSLNKHTLDMHSVKKHVCNECGRCFTYPSAMRDHMRKAHSMVISARK